MYVYISCCIYSKTTGCNSTNMFTFVLSCLALAIFCDSANGITNCTTPNGERANCISIFSCKKFLSAAIDANNDTLLFLKQSVCGNTMVCCGTSTSFDTKSTTAAPTINTKWKPLPSRRICGLQHTDDRYYTNLQTAIDEFPWMAQILYKNEEDGTVKDQCAGSLINRRYVLTAAHCLINREAVVSKIMIRLGEYDRLNATDCAHNPDFPECTDPVIDLDVEKTIIYPDYKPPKKTYDIALIRISKNVQFSDFIRPICLPAYGYENTTVGQILTTSGWGLGTFAGDRVRVKKRGTTKVIGQEECQRQFNGRQFVINEKILCAISLTDSTCQGDSGGPVMSKSNFQWQQDGIVSFGKLCGNGSYEGHTRVAEYMDWIIQNIEP